MKISEMTDEQLVRAVAEEVMGWAWHPASASERVSGWWFKHGKEVFHIVGNQLIPVTETWNPLTDANHRDMVVERMIVKGFDVHMDYYTDDNEGWQVKFVNESMETKWLDGWEKTEQAQDEAGEKLDLSKIRKQIAEIKTPYSINKRKGRAVLEAALAAVRGGGTRE